ncbi:MAG: hypothetical protein Q8O13_02550 [Candidatus Omnitrophota bacterium]|nr:hypothetical protein [Candidatus Omnitrophota bacterium]
MKIKYLTIFFSIFLLYLSPTIALCQDSDFKVRFNFTSNPDEELIFMKLRRSLFTNTKARDAQKAKFGIAEYYFKHNDFSDASRDFKDYLKSYPSSESTLLAKIYLYQIAQIKNDVELKNSYKKDIFDNTFILLFSEFKVLKYKSVFSNNYEIHYYVDKIKVFLNGELFAEIIP